MIFRNKGTHSGLPTSLDADGVSMTTIPEMFRKPGGPTHIPATSSAATIGLPGIGFFVCEPGETIKLPDDVSASAVLASCPALELVEGNAA